MNERYVVYSIGRFLVLFCFVEIENHPTSNGPLFGVGDLEFHGSKTDFDIESYMDANSDSN